MDDESTPAARRARRCRFPFHPGSGALRFTHPELRAQARQAAAHTSLAPTTTPSQSVAEAIDRMGSVSERMVNDRLEQALIEDMEDFVQQRVEGGLGLPVQGRGRGYVRRLPSKYESAYQKEARLEVHRYLYWWLRKRQRLALGHLAMFKTPREIDRARNRGPVWKLTSGISEESWAQNRLRIDFKWGELNWEIEGARGGSWGGSQGERSLLHENVASDELFLPACVC